VTTSHLHSTSIFVQLIATKTRVAIIPANQVLLLVACLVDSTLFTHFVLSQ
jgi:hypothetical protein